MSGLRETRLPAIGRTQRRGRVHRVRPQDPDPHRSRLGRPMTPEAPATRAARQRMLLAREVAEQIAKEHGVCIRPLVMRRLDTHTGKTEEIDLPCGATLDSKCPPCAARNRYLR